MNGLKFLVITFSLIGLFHPRNSNTGYKSNNYTSMLNSVLKSVANKAHGVSQVQKPPYRIRMTYKVLSVPYIQQS